MTANVKIRLPSIKSVPRFPWSYLLLAYSWTWLFWIVGTNQSRYLSVTAFVLFVAFVTSGSFYNTWCYNENRRSTLAVILLHTVANLALDTFLLPGTGEYIFKIVAAFGAALIAIAWNLPWRNRKLIPALICFVVHTLALGLRCVVIQAVSDLYLLRATLANV